MSLQRLGPYRIIEELGVGGMGTVFAAEVDGRAPGIEQGTRVALKVVHGHLLETPGFFKRFMREGEVGKSVRHPNVVRTFDTDALVEDGEHRHFLVMEFVEGQTLRDLLVELDRVPEELCRHIGREIAKGLTAIHGSSVVHRDLKPENVLITPDNEVKVMDLGVARLQDEVVRLSQTGAFVGSVHYAAPEQFGGGGEVDHRADLHALGLLLYELGCGQHPYSDEDFRVTLKRLLHEEPRRVAEINPQLSPFFEQVVHTLIAKAQEERIQTADEVVAILEEGEESAWWEERAKELRLETKQPLRRIRIPRETALYGRDAELAKLSAVFEQAKAGDGQVLLLEGEAGIGKTRLVDEFVGLMRQAGEDLSFLFGTYPPGGAASAGGAFSTAFREHLGPEGSAPYLSETQLLVPAFDALLRGDATPTGVEPLTRDSLVTCFVHTLRALAAERTTILLIDDLQFAPEDARSLFSAIALAVPGHPVLLVGTVRPGVSQEWHANLTRLDHAHQLGLQRLGPKDLVHLLKDTFRSERLAQELGLQIAVKSDGNPFFAFEIIRGLRDGKFITQTDDGSWARTQVIDRIQIPSTVMDLIQARISDLNEEERDVLDVAACCGYEFDPAIVATAAGLAVVPTLKRLGRIEKTHRVIRSAGRHCIFDHYQIQQALYDGILEQLREHYHGAIADAIEAREKAADKDPEELDGALCVELCEHYLKSGSAERSLRYLTPALEHLAAGYLHDPALALADRALSISELLSGAARTDALLQRATRLGTLGRHEDERAALEEALLLADEAGNPLRRTRVRRHLGSYLARVGESDAAISLLEEALTLVREVGDRTEEARTHGALGTAMRTVNRYAEAMDHLSRQLALVQEVGDARAEASATGSLGIIYRRLGRLAEARAHHERQAELARHVGDRGAELSAEAGLGALMTVLCRHDEARAHKMRQIAIAREVGDRAAEATGTGNLGEDFRATGEYARAQDHYQRAWDLDEELGQATGLVVTGINLGETAATVGDSTRAREWLRAGRSLARECGIRELASFAHKDLGLLAVEAGDVDEGERRCREALAELRAISVPPYVAEVLVDLGGLLADAGRLDDARAVLDEGLELATELEAPNQIVLAAAYLASLPGGDAAAAVEALTDHGPRAWHVKRMRALFLLWKATDDASHLAEAHNLLVHLRDHAPEECRESVVENVPLHRDIWAAATQAGL